MKRTVWRLLGPDSEHDDLVQQVFLNALRSCHQIREPERLQGWLRRVTVYTICRELRRRMARRALEGDASISHFEDPASDVELTDRLLSAKRVIERMPARDRTVFVLHRLEHYTVAELAQTFGWSRATAKRRISAAHARFRRLAGKDSNVLPLRQ